MATNAHTALRTRFHRPGFSTVVWAVVCIGLAYLILVNAGELKSIGSAIRSARLPYIAAAVGIEILFVLNLSRFYVTVFRAGGLKADTRRFVLVTAASHFINLVSKTSGFGGLSVYLREGKRNEEQASRIGAAYLMANALGHVAFFGVLAVALALVATRGTLTAAEATASAVILTLVGLIGLTLAVALRRRSSFAALLSFLVGIANRASRVFLRRAVFNTASVRDTADELYDALILMIHEPLRFALPMAHALGVELLSALLLLFAARAMNADIGFLTALVGYSFALLFSLVAFTPAGLGFVEASLAVLLVSFGVPRTNALAAMLVFRLFDFWLPVLFGAISLTMLRRSPRVE